MLLELPENGRHQMKIVAHMMQRVLMHAAVLCPEKFFSAQSQLNASRLETDARSKDMICIISCNQLSTLNEY